jgi:hypothetical protein
LFFMRLKEAFEGLSLKQRAPEIESELGCALLKLFYQIAYLRDPCGGFAVSTMSNSPMISALSKHSPVFQVPDQRHETMRFQDPRKLRCGGVIVRAPMEGLKRMRTTLTDVGVEI